MKARRIVSRDSAISAGSPCSGSTRASGARPCRAFVSTQPTPRLRTFLHLKDLVSQETMRLAVDFFSRFLIRCVHQTEDLALAFIQPILEVFDPVLSLNLEILHMGVGDIFRFRPRDVIVNIQE